MEHAPSGAPGSGTPGPGAPDLGGVPALARGPRLAVDVGTVRVGLAASDPDGMLATPVETLARDQRDRPGRLPKDLARVVREARERCASCVYVGLPRHLSGAESASSQTARAYAGTLAQAVAPVEVRLVDERMSTVSAHQALWASGRSGRRHREVVDQAAAVVILQYALDAERATGRRPGERVEVDPALGPTGEGAVGDATDDGGATRT